MAILDEEGLGYFWNKIKDLIGRKVDKVEGKGLSTNDYTAEEKEKLSMIEAGANKYEHPSYVPKANGLYKITVSPTGHVAGAVPVTKTDITDLGISETGADALNYCECNTYTSVTEKKVTLTGFKLESGARIIVRFKYGNIATNPTLNVNGTGAKPIYYRNSNIPEGMLRKYAVIEFVYSGTYWYVVGDIDETILLAADDVVPTAISTWIYTPEIPELKRYNEIRAWVEIGDGFRGWVTLTVDDPKDVIVTGYVSATYNGNVWLKWDIEDCKIGLYVRTVNGLSVSSIKIGEIEGVKKVL